MAHLSSSSIKHAGEWIVEPIPKKLRITLERALEWRLFAFIISGLVLYAATGRLLESTLLSILLQIFLFIGHVVWYYYRGYTHK